MPNPAERARALKAGLMSLHQTFGKRQLHLGRVSASNSTLCGEIDIVVCTVKDDHTLGMIPDNLYTWRESDGDPLMLGYECHKALGENIGSYDYYCYMEDDLLLSDPLFFWKIAWFSKSVGNESLLQPNRFELSIDDKMQKLYIDGPLKDIGSALSRNEPAPTSLTGNVLGQSVCFEQDSNPHSGCFFLNNAQMKHWASKPYFIDYAKDFFSPLESAATLGIARTFNIYKPVAANAAFLEIRHLDRRYLSKQELFRDRRDHGS